MSFLHSTNFIPRSNLGPCSICPGKYPVISSDGPTPCDYMCIAERPGQDENRGGRPFIGRAGREFNENYLPLAGLSRDEVFIANTVQCASFQNKTPTPQEIAICSAHHIPQEYWECNPRIVILMGSVACSLAPAINLKTHHGILQRTTFMDHQNVLVFPVNHPAAGLHDGKMMIPLLEDFRTLRDIIRTGQSNAPIDAHPNPIYAELTSPDEVEAILTDDSTLSLHCGMDTETVENKAWCLTFSVEPGTGFMLHKDSREALQTFNRIIRKQRRPISVHHALYARDVEFMQDLGVDIGDLIFCDTAHEAYHLGNLPQGLKPLGYRLLGVHMHDYNDLVMPYSRAAVVEWLNEALVIADAHPRVEYTPIKSKAKKYLEAPTTIYLDGAPHKRVEKPTWLFGRIKGILRYTEKPIDPNADSHYNPWRTWDEMDEGDNGEVVESKAADKYLVESRIGKMPAASLEQVTDRERVIKYACLNGKTKIKTINGLMAIANFVKQRSTIPVETYNTQTNEVEYRVASNWFRNEHEEKIDWMYVLCEQSRNLRDRVDAGKYTHDHKLLTDGGWKQVIDIQAEDKIYLPVRALDVVQKQVAYGSLLGDGTLAKRNKGGWAALVISHCERQHPYLEWKKELLGDGLCVREPYLDRSGGSGICTIAGKQTVRSEFKRITTICHPELDYLHSKSYITKTKSVGEWVDSIEALGLAIWYLDDGTLVEGKTPRFYTLRYSISDVDRLRELLRTKFGIQHTTRFESHKDQWAIGVGVASADVFFGLICTFVPPCMQYKIPVKWRGKFTTDIPIRNKPELFASKVIGVYKAKNLAARGDKKTSYCIEVPITHNFMTQYEVAKNCEDARITHELTPILMEMAGKVGWDVYSGDYDI